MKKNLLIYEKDFQKKIKLTPLKVVSLFPFFIVIMSIMKKTKITYKKNFLDSVVFRIDFEKIDMNSISSFSDCIRKHFPISEFKVESVNTITFEAKVKKAESKVSEMGYWSFLSLSKNKELLIFPNHMSINYKNNSYLNLDELTKDFDIIFLEFIKHFSIETLNRVGLRYLNRVNLDSAVKDVDKFKWSEFFSKELTSGLDFAYKNKISPTRALAQMFLKIDDVSEIIFNYGVWNSDFPSVITRKEFILDIDCYSKFPINTNITEELKNILLKYNKDIQFIFERSITDRLRSILK